MVNEALARLQKTSALKAQSGFWLSERDYRDMQLVIAAYQVDGFLAQILLDITEHHRQHPDHGLDCACMDEHIRKLRAVTTAPDKDSQRRIDYVIQAALRR